MERYGQATDQRSGSDPSPEWTTSVDETTLDASMRRLRLGSGGESYPERSEEPDCIYYLRTGFCGYGSRCRFNHPRDRGAVMQAARVGLVEHPERLGQPICQYFIRAGTCKFGASCKYHHPRQRGGFAGPVPLNYLGYPLRPGEKECTYYMKTGQCKYGQTCKFDHPVAPGVQVPVAGHAVYHPSVQSQFDPSSQRYGVIFSRPQLMPGSYVQSPYGPLLLTPSVVPYSGWSPYQESGSVVPSPEAEPSVGSSSYYGVMPFAGTYQHGSSSVGQIETKFPQRPGQPECQYYMRTGDCKYGSSCRYHHPLEEMVAPNTSVVLSPIGLPLRPGAPSCSHYVQYGVCKFGAACRFDHPMDIFNYSPSLLTVLQFPVGTQAPSSSESNQEVNLTEVVTSTLRASGDSIGHIVLSGKESDSDLKDPEPDQGDTTKPARVSS